MQIKFVRSPDLDILESTANMLFMEGWEAYSGLQTLPNGDFLMAFIKYGYSRQTGQPVPTLQPVEHTSLEAGLFNRTALNYPADVDIT
jgi:hypothetical protein